MYKQNKKVDMYEKIIDLAKLEFYLIAQGLVVVLALLGVISGTGLKNKNEFAESVIRNTHYIDLSLLFIFIVTWFTVGNTVINQFKGINSPKSNEIGIIFIPLAFGMGSIAQTYINYFPLRISIIVSFVAYSLILLIILIRRSIRSENKAKEI